MTKGDLVTIENRFKSPGYESRMKTLGVCLLTIFLNCSPGLDGLQSKEADRKQGPDSTDALKRKWRISGMGELESSDGEPLSFTAYKSTDGFTVTIIHGVFPSEARAAAEFNRVLRDAVKVVKQAPNNDAKGNNVGNRACILVSSSHPDTPDVGIVWTEGQRFVEVISASSAVAHEWENRYKVKPPSANSP